MVSMSRPDYTPLPPKKTLLILISAAGPPPLHTLRRGTGSREVVQCLTWIRVEVEINDSLP